jgi:hypothetical protein
MVVFVAQFLKITDHTETGYMSLDDFVTLEKWVKRYHPQEKLKYWSYHPDGGEVEFYL